MKKVLSMLLALAMVLTMAAFPAFAEGETVALTAITNPNPQSGHTSDMAVDGDESTFYATSGYLGSAQDASSSYKLKIELAETITLDSLELYWSGSGWGYFPANKYKVHVSEDNVTYTEILYYENLCAGTDTYDGKIVYGGSVGSGNLKARVTETDLNVKDVKYIYIEMIGWKYRAALAEVYVTKRDTAGLTPATYTVKYEYEDGTQAAEDKVVTDYYVGDVVTEDAVDVVGYNPDAASKELTLAEGTNEIVFTYYPREAASYTVYYQDTEGNDLADSTVVTEGLYEGDVVTITPVTVAGHKPTEASKTVTLAAGENEIVFTYEEKANVTYTVVYADEQGNTIATAKTGSGYDGDTVTETPATVSGYFCTDAVRSVVHTLVADGDNTIIFTYKKILVPATITAKYASGVSNSGGNTSDWKSFNDGVLTRTVQYAPVGASYDPTIRSFEFTIAYPGLKEFDTLTLINSANRASEVNIYTSLDGEKWDLVINDTDKSDNETKVKVTHENGSATDMFVTSYDLGGAKGLYVKYEVMASPAGGWCGIYEAFVEGSDIAAADLSDAKVIANNSWGWNDGGIENDPSLLFDGESATNKKGYYAYIYASSTAQPKNYFIEIDLGAIYEDPMVAIQGGASDWNYAHLLAYDVYVAGIDGKYGDTPAATVDKGTNVDAAGVKVRTDILEIEGVVRYVKLVVNYALRRPVIGEITVYGDKVDFTAEPEKAGTALGASIRVPSEIYTLGLRFGATIMKSALGTVGVDYDYDALVAAGVKVGMYVLPVHQLDGSATLTEYLAGGVKEALDIPAKRIVSETDNAIVFSAVLTEIPETEFETDIIAVPYVCIDGEYTYYTEMTRNYKGVAGAIAQSFLAGNTSLKEHEITYLETLLGLTLTTPDAE